MKKTTEEKLRDAHEVHDYWQNRRANASSIRELNYARTMEKRALLKLYKAMEGVECSLQNT
jgi:hypothetical protein